MRWTRAALWMVFVATEFATVRVGDSQNATSAAAPSSRRSGHRDPNIMAALQQIQLQLGALEGESQRQTSRIQEVNRVATRLEIQKQDMIGMLDRFEGRISQRLDGLKSDIRKVVTLQEVIRDDLEKVQQNQLLNKVWLEQQLQHINNNQEPDTATRIQAEPKGALLGGADLMSNLQVLQTNVHSLRRMSDALQTSLSIVIHNVTKVANVTRQIYEHITLDGVTKSYLQSSLQALLTETQDNQQHFGYLAIGALQNHESDEDLPRDCKQVQDKIQNVTGIYRILPNYAQKPIFVFCDMETEGGGWTVIQRRRDGSVDFLREWNDYKHGFGNVAGEFWLGNENLYLITHQSLYELRVDLYDFEDGHAYSNYAGFAVGSEKERYMLKLLGSITKGDAGDGLTYHASLPFSTIDMDNDRWEGGSCAQDHTGGWWYNQCDASNLNGQYLRGLTQQEYKGVYWHEWQGPNYSLMGTQMMIRPVQYTITGKDIQSTDKEKEVEESTTITSTTPAEETTTTPESDGHERIDYYY